MAQKRDALSAPARNRQRGRDSPLAPQMAAGKWEAADSPTEHMAMESAELVRVLSPELEVQDGGISCQITNPRCKGCPSICPTTECWTAGLVPTLERTRGFLIFILHFVLDEPAAYVCHRYGNENTRMSDATRFDGSVLME